MITYSMPIWATLLGRFLLGEKLNRSGWIAFVLCVSGVCTLVWPLLAGGIPSGAAIELVRKGGERVVCFAPALAIARNLVRMGSDAIVIEGSEAGGHIGPVSTAVLAQEILPHVTEVPVFVAGGIGEWWEVLAAQCSDVKRRIARHQLDVLHGAAKALNVAVGLVALPLWLIGQGLRDPFRRLLARFDSGPAQPPVPARHEHVDGVGNVVAEVVQDERALMGNDGLVRTDGEPSLADVDILAAWETTDTVKSTADVLEPASADMMIQELATDAMRASLLGGEVTGLVIRLRLQAQHVMHRSSIA